MATCSSPSMKKKATREHCEAFIDLVTFIHGGEAVAWDGDSTMFKLLY